MCGLAGIWSFLDATSPSEAELRRMADAMEHRGPDGEGLAVHGRCGFAHRRLSIIDLAGGAQPIGNEDGSVQVVFNGELYNHEELRTELVARGHRFATRCDTEVLVHLYEEHGDALVHRLRGMFAFALHDRARDRLLVARDRLGIKPLYFAWTDGAGGARSLAGACPRVESSSRIARALGVGGSGGASSNGDASSRDGSSARGDEALRGERLEASGGALVFSSEIRSLLAAGRMSARPNPRALRRFLCYDYLPGDESQVAGVMRLEPGCRLVADASGLRVDRWWWLDFPREKERWSFEESVERLGALLGDAVEEHLMSDVPVGVLLSGGVDSSAVTALARARGANDLKSFTVGFDGGFEAGDARDERPIARLVAERFGTEHHEITFGPEDFWSGLTELAAHLEDPVCEPPAVALLHVSRLASRHVKVVLSGEGGDEAFAGYSTYPNELALERLRAKLPAEFLRRAAAGALAPLAARSRRWARLRSGLRHPLERRYFSRTSHPGRTFVAHPARYLTPDALAAADLDWCTAPTRERLESMPGALALDRMLAADTASWLVDDLLLKADKTTMATSIELRVPLLDHRVLEFAARLPREHLLQGRAGKRVLRAVLESLVPREVLERPKAGFPVPYEHWLRGELRERVREVLLDPSTLSRGLLRREGVESLLRAHANGEPVDKEVFDLLVLELSQRGLGL